MKVMKVLLGVLVPCLVFALAHVAEQRRFKHPWEDGGARLSRSPVMMGSGVEIGAVTLKDIGDVPLVEWNLPELPYDGSIYVYYEGKFYELDRRVIKWWNGNEREHDFSLLEPRCWWFENQSHKDED